MSTQPTRLAVIAPEAETPVQRATRLQREAKTAAMHVVAEALNALLAAELAMAELATIEAVPAGVRDIAARLADSLKAPAMSIDAIMGRYR